MDTTKDIFQFEGFCLDRRRGGLFRRLDGGAMEPLAIGSRALEILGILIDRHGELITKNDLIDAAWPGTVVEESNLSVQISALRRLLDHGRSEGSCIQTIPGRGYRFVVSVRRVESETSSISAPIFSTAEEWPIAETVLAWGSIPRDGLGSTPLAPIQRIRHRLQRTVVATIAGTTILAAALTAWNWHSLWFGAVHPPAPLSIVVLPFANLSNDPEQQYFVDGITEDLTTDLSRIQDSFVISRNTAFTYKDKPINARQIGRELGVRYVLGHAGPLRVRLL